MPRDAHITRDDTKRFPSMLGAVYVSNEGVEREISDVDAWDIIEAHVPHPEILQDGFIAWEGVAALDLTVADRYYPYITVVLAEEEFESEDDLDWSLHKVKHIYFVDNEESGKPGWDHITDCFTAMKKKLLAYREKYDRSGYLTVDYTPDTGDVPREQA